MTDLDTRPRLRVVKAGDDRRQFASPGVIVAVGVLVTVLVLLGWLLLGKGHRQAPSSAAPGIPVAVPLGKPAVTGALTCPSFRHAKRGVPITAPPVTWQIVDTVAVPFSTTAGPAVVDGGVARCYAHTATGALIADEQISARYLISADWRKVAERQLVPGPGVAIYTKERATVSSSSAPGDYCQSAAYSVLSYSPARAVIELVARCGADLQAITTTVAWSGSDWRLVLFPNGSEAPTATAVANLTGFVPFGGV